jgi:hypothetical protein
MGTDKSVSQFSAVDGDGSARMVCAISSGVPARFIGTPETKAAFFAAVPVNRFRIPVSIGPGRRR